VKSLEKYNFNSKESAGLLIVAGGFEDRAKTFVKRLQVNNFECEQSLIIKYDNDFEQNGPNYVYLLKKLTKISKSEPKTVNVHGSGQQVGFVKIRDKILEFSSILEGKNVFIDISGMPHLFALCCIHYCLMFQLDVRVIYSEAKFYYPQKKDQIKLVNAWINSDFEVAEKYLQSAALKEVNIIPEFSGSFRPGKLTCLILFVGYEPNRIEGLIDDYAPGRLIVYYGKSPHKEFFWRAELSKELHKNLFSKWYHREELISTLEIDEIIQKLEYDFKVLYNEFDIAICPQCSKIQAIACYLFWKNHPEVQLIFTTPVRFHPKKYSIGEGDTFILNLIKC
jgi:hypothetical protein